MRRCILCQTDKQLREFARKSPICRDCVQEIEVKYKIEYSPPEKVSSLEAQTKLIGAIRDQAIEDGELEDWESYWLKEPEWKMVWELAKVETFVNKTLPDV